MSLGMAHCMRHPNQAKHIKLRVALAVIEPVGRRGAALSPWAVGVQH